MKKIIMFAACATIFASCAEEDIKQSVQPDPGTEIKFALKLDGSKQTRTLYGKEENNAFPIYWVNNDQIIVASPQCAAGRNNALYKIAVNNGTSSSAESVTKVDEAGVQWGDNLPANFYSIYPVSYNSSASTEVRNTITNGTDNAVAHLNVRNYQINLFTKDNNNVWNGTPIDRKSMTDLNANQKNPDALMYAQTKQTTAGDVLLTYKPFTVAFNITLQGYTFLETLGDKTPVTIQEVTITAPPSTHLVGNFDATFNADCKTAPAVNTNGNKLAEGVRNVIHVPMLRDLDGHYLVLGQDESVNFNVFAIPTNKTVSGDWTLTVRTDKGTFSRPLTPGTGANAGNLIAGQMHKLDMPKFQITNTAQIQPETWMARIPRNVFLSELSVPGAWYASQSEYQGANITYASLWEAGVRAFAVETRRTVELSGLPVRSRNAVVVSGTGNNVAGAYTPTIGTIYIRTVMSNIISQLQNNPNEYAIIVLSYADGGEGGHRTEDYAGWLQGIYNEYNSLTTTQKRYVYTDAITPNTTVGDVAGKLIIKVNVGGNLPGGNITIGNYGNNLPGLLSYTDIAWEASHVNSSLISQMYWSIWNNSYLTNVSGDLTTLPSANLYWNYTLANRTSLTAGNGIPTYSNRQDAIKSILNNSRSVYESGDHNVWFFIGAGGVEATAASGGTTNATAFAENMNGWINTQILNRINGQDSEGNKVAFSPFGIVMCNYITNATYSGPTIIQNIIHMNSLVDLKVDTNKEPWPNSGQNNVRKRSDYSSWTEVNPLSVF